MEVGAPGGPQPGVVPQQKEEVLGQLPCLGIHRRQREAQDPEEALQGAGDHLREDTSTGLSPVQTLLPKAGAGVPSSEGRVEATCALVPAFQGAPSRVATFPSWAACMPAPGYCCEWSLV